MRSDISKSWKEQDENISAKGKEKENFKSREGIAFQRLKRWKETEKEKQSDSCLHEMEKKIPVARRHHREEKLSCCDHFGKCKSIHFPY